MTETDPHTWELKNQSYDSPGVAIDLHDGEKRFLLVRVYTDWKRNKDLADFLLQAARHYYDQNP